MSKPFIDSNVVLYLLSGDAAKADRAKPCYRRAVKAACDVQPLTARSHEKAVELAKRFKLPLHDANIVVNALISGAQLLLSEDMHSGLVIDGLLIQNPFVSALS